MIVDYPGENFGRGPSWRSAGVTRGHQQVFATNSRLKRATDMGVISFCLSGQDASTDIQHGLFGSTT